MRRDQRQGRAPDHARGRRRPPLPRGLTAKATPVKLRDDSEVVVRPIDAGDKDAITEVLAHLSEQSRYQRFLRPIAELSKSDLRYFTEVDHHDHEALIAFDPATGAPLGVARFVRLDDPAQAEAAVAVVDDWQGRGLGTTLTQMLAARAREEGVDTFVALLLATNRQMHDVLSSLGPTHVISRDAGTLQIEVGIPADGIGEHMAGVLRVAAGGTVDLATPPWGLRPASGG